MKVFVTGATGLIGSAVVRSLVAAGHEVTGLTSRKAGVPAVEKLGARAVVGDMADASAYREVAGAADAVVHAASSMPDKIRMSATDVKTFMEADRAAVEALASVIGPRCKAFVVSSGAYVYGDTGQTPVPEDRGTAQHHAVMDIKVQIEDRVRELARTGKAPGIVVRPAMVYGNGGLWWKLYLRDMQKKKKAMMPGGKQFLSFVHVDDVGEAYRALVEKPVPGETYNIADDRPERLETVVRAQADALGAPPPWSAPSWLLHLVAGRFGAPPTLANTVISNAKLRALGWTPRYPTWREGIPALTASLSAS